MRFIHKKNIVIQIQVLHINVIHRHKNKKNVRTYKKKEFQFLIYLECVDAIHPQVHHQLHIIANRNRKKNKVQMNQTNP